MIKYLILIMFLLVACSPNYPIVISEKSISSTGACYYKLDGAFDPFLAPCNFAEVGDTLTVVGK